MRLVGLNSIKPEMKLAKAIYSDNRVLLNVGISNLYRYKKRLKDLGVEYIYVEDDISEDIEVNDIVRAETKQECKKAVKDVIESVSFNKSINFKEIEKSINKVVEELLKSNEVMLNLVNVKSYNSYTLDHSVNVAVLSILLAKKLSLTEKEMYKLGVGAILHDIGKMLIPKKILNKPSSLTEEEFAIIKKHPRLGYEYLKDNSSISPLSRIVVLSHHERLNGTGYPRGIKDEDIHKFAKIVSIADVFDALTSNRIYRSRWSAKKSIDYLLANAGNLFNNEYVREFIQSIAVYPNGVKVKLDNGQLAIVKEQNNGYPLRPVIKIINKSNSNVIKIIDLLEQRNRIIIDTVFN